MKKIKGQSRLTKFIASRVAKANRLRFAALSRKSDPLQQLYLQLSGKPIDLKLVSFSSSGDYPEQVLSILSFVRYVGVPRLWTIYSDGTHTLDEAQILQRVFPFVQISQQFTDKTYFSVCEFKPLLEPFKQELTDFASHHFLGKKLSLYLNHTIDAPTLFLDSDVLFYKQSATLPLSTSRDVRGWFLSEKKWGCLDSRYIAQKAPETHQVNSGFFLMNDELSNVIEGLVFLKTLQRTYEYFSEQTVIHILLTNNQFSPLDASLFVLDTIDQFDFSYAYDPSNIAVRHYTGPVRHKMWQRNWRWHLSLM